MSVITSGSARASDQGQVLPLVAVLVVLVAGVALLLVRVGSVVDDRARASAAADAAALAGAAEGRDAAAEVAAANGATLEQFTVVDGETVVVVRFGAARASARAARTVGDPPATWRPGWPADRGGATAHR